VADSTIVDALSKYFTKPGDVFFLPAGRVHAIGQGNFVLEIQEASDITYRIYDYNRRDAEGNLRQLHVDESVDAINYADVAQEVKNVAAAPGREAMVEDCRYFTTTLVNVDGTYDLELASRNSFTILVATKGDLVAVAPDGEEFPLPQGQTLLVPAEMPQVVLRGKGEVVTVYIK
ncbi:MAG: mannose-6-phosphate isomerase, partial [Muribaculaceae bacterium]|nr:mannose-6-phosphate isomerase [Muribaculaceae bacterium]